MSFTIQKWKQRIFKMKTFHNTIRIVDIRCKRVISNLPLFRSSTIFAFLLDSKWYESWRSTHFFLTGILCVWTQLPLQSGWVWLLSDMEKWRQGMAQEQQVVLLLCGLNHFVSQQVDWALLMNPTLIHSFIQGFKKCTCMCQALKYTVMIKDIILIDSSLGAKSGIKR